jgi:hypothetical protein
MQVSALCEMVVSRMSLSVVIGYYYLIINIFFRIVALLVDIR